MFRSEFQIRNTKIHKLVLRILLHSVGNLIPTVAAFLVTIACYITSGSEIVRN